MTIKFLFPNCFLGEEKDFLTYCALKLLRGNYISKEEAQVICGSSKDELDALYNNFEKEYIEKCDGPYAGWVFEKDPDLDDML